MRDFDVSKSRWTPISKVEKKGEQYWVMECECGTKREVSYRNYLRGSSISCGCYMREVARSLADSRRKPPGVRARNKVMYIYKKHAKTAGREFSLTTEEFTELTSASCHYCGRPPMRTHTPFTRPERSTTTYDYNGIDRKDSSLGYILENCLTCCTECNRAKMDMSYEDFIIYLDTLAAFRTKSP